MLSLIIVVRRQLKSLKYLRDPSKPFDWGNNDNNNSLDSFEVFDVNTGAGDQPRGSPIFSCRAQTVANTEGLIGDTKFTHTIAPGTFNLKAFVELRMFYGRIHGLCNCRTTGGDWISDRATIRGNEDRWLVHDWQKHRNSGPPGHDTRVAWSAGCFVIPDSDLEKLGTLFDKKGILPGNMIPGLLQEVA